MQHVIVKFSPDSDRTYTYHNEGPPVAAGDKVVIETGKGTKAVEVVRVATPAPDDPPLGFKTKGILGLAPPPPEEEGAPS